MEIAGAFDDNFKELERFTGSKIYFRGNSVVIKGKKFENEDTNYIEKEFNNILLENGYESFFDYLKLKKFVKLIMSE